MIRPGLEKNWRFRLNKRVNLKKILADRKLKRELIIGVIQATQAREGIKTTKEQATIAYDSVQKELEV
jgi:hypothetical protein